MKITLGTHPACIGDCGAFAEPLHSQLSAGQYDWPASILLLDDIDAYLAAHRTARKRAQRARNLGYTFSPIRREQHEDEIHAINISAPERQGQPMSAGYLERPTFSPLPGYQCPRHRIDTYGVFADSVGLVAYLVFYVCGDLAMISQILGHAAVLADDIMYLLATGTFRDELDRSGPLTVFYNRHDSGTDGLRYFKERLGFAPERVEWARVITADDVTACLVTRGDADLAPIIETLPYGELVVWDNSERDEDLKVFGRYAAIAEATRPVIFFQDDDCIFRHHAELLAEYEPGVLTANWGHGEDPCGYDDLAIFPGGALLDRDLPGRAFDRYLEHFPRDDGFLYEADFIFGCLTPFKHLRLPFEIRDLAYNGKRLADQPWQRELKLRITNQARWIRDHASGVPSRTASVSTR